MISEYIIEETQGPEENDNEYVNKIQLPLNNKLETETTF